MPDESQRARIEQLFEASLEQPAVHRDGWLQVACGGDAELLAEVRRLLAAHGVGQAAFPTDGGSDTHSAPERVLGPYRLLHELGRGGMGTVHVAERDDGVFRRRVAIKLLHPGGERDELLARFVAERQILASLDHPNIARLLDGGITEAGRPYFVMEYIDGVPLDRYADRQRLDVQARLRLIATIARAVHYAHGRLVVHRDLKPSNVLVTPDGVVKLLDFGIAKIHDPTAVNLTRPAPRTRTGLLLLTPAYASPEQFRGEPATTANDVWSLGVMLYELLTARRPFALEGLSLSECERVVTATDPPRPSEVAESPGLRRRLAGDVDRMVLAALRKEPERRYGSAEQLAEDINRHLEGKPIWARSDSAGYRARKFVLRHRVGVSVAAGLLLMLMAYAASLVIQGKRVRLALDEARVEAARAERVNELLLALFEAGSADSTPGDSAALAALQRRLALAEGREQHPGERAEMLHTLGVVHHRLGDFRKATSLLEEALALHRTVHGSRHLGVTGVLTSLGDAYRMQQRYPEAQAALREALDTERALLGREHPRIARNLNDLALVLRDAGDYEAAEPPARQALRMRRDLLGGDDPAVATSLNDLAALLRRRGRFREALPLYQEALEIRRRAYPGDHWLVAETINNVGVQLRQIGDLAGAEPLLREAMAMYRRVYGDRHPYTAVAAANLGFLLLDRNELDEAEQLLLEALEVEGEVYGYDHHQITITMNRLGALALRRGELADAERLYRAAMATTGRIRPPDHPDAAREHHGLGVLHRARGNRDSARTHLEQALAIREARLAGHPAVAETLEELATLSSEEGDRIAAERFLVRALEIRRNAQLPEAPAVQAVADRLASLHQESGRPEAAPP
jgi:serine/threonine-protein kinase